MIWEGFYYAGSGYGEAARQYTLALDALGMAVTAKLAPCQDDRHLLAKDVLARLERLMKRRPEPGEVWVQQVLPTAFTVAPGAGANVGYTVFEADGIPRHWARACNRMDEVWVPSQFCVESFSGSGVKLGKLRVIPHGVDVRRFGPGTQPLEIEGARGFVFLSVFDWVKRKGWDLLLRAYWSEFEASE
jgi:glycosyltransferase involved in cell wall biosynthesis